MHASDDVADAPGYDALLDRAALCAERVSSIDAPVEACGSAAFIALEARRLAKAWPVRADSGPQPTAADDMLQVLVEHWPAIASGAISGEEIMRTRTDLWERFMTEWPLGAYAHMTAAYLRDGGLLHGRVLELGAGVGNTSRLVAQLIEGEYIRTDLVRDLLMAHDLPGSVERYDFNRPSRWRGLDTVFAVNALHCARDRVGTLHHIYRALRPGGTLVLGEGSPETMEGLPWALTFLCGLFAGWWDEGGFVARATWLDELHEAGFSQVGVQRLVSGGHDLGGVLVGVRPMSSGGAGASS